MDKLWCDNVKLLFHEQRLLEFFPNKQMHINEQINAISRFVIYAGILLAMHKRDPFVLVAAAGLVLVLAGIVKHKDIPSWSSGIQPAHTFPKECMKTKKHCTKPTTDNPFANVLVTDERNRPSACSADEVFKEINDSFFDGFDQDPFDIFNKKHSQRQFFSTASTQIPNEQGAFAEWCYGSNKKGCKEDNSICTGTEAFGS